MATDSSPSLVASGRAPADPATRRAFLDWVGDLVHRHRAGLAGVARQEGLAPEEAFDVVQESFQTFIGLPEAPRLVEAPEEAQRLLTTVTRNAARNRRRLHAHARPHISDPAVLDNLATTTGVEETIAAAEEHARLASCMLTLEEVPRAVVTLRMLEELPGEDVARILGLTSGNVAVLLHRAKARLLTCMSTCGDR